MDKWIERAVCVGAGVAVGMYMCQQSQKSQEEDDVTKTVLAFLDAQSERDLDLMCDLVADDVVYINEPHPPERAIKGKEMFRHVFAGSPCIWCPEAKLKVLQYCRKGDTVFVERLDQFKVEGSWIRVPICGYLRVRDGKVAFWKDYWDYAKYKAFVTATYGPDFSLFKRSKK